MRVPVKQLDNVSNLVGELVVYRNTLEQDQERLRQFLDNLLHQVQQLGNLSSRMQELYEQSLLKPHNKPWGYPVCIYRIISFQLRSHRYGHGI